MPEHADTHIGSRLRDVRKRRGLTQRELAAASGVSLSLIRKLEQGELHDTRLETARRLAVAMRIPTTQLLKRDTDSADPDTVDRWAPVRRALAAPPRHDDPTEPPTVDGVRAAIDAALLLRAKHEFATLATVLPPLIRDADILAGLTPEGRALRFRLMLIVGWLLTQTRQFDAAGEVLAQYEADAQDGVQGAAMANTWCWLLLRQGRLEEARNMALRWADDSEPTRLSRATAEEVSAWGWMLLRVSNCAVRDARDGEADPALRLAKAAASTLGREMRSVADPMRTFGPTTVALKTCENAMITDRPDRVLELARPLAAAGGHTSVANWNRHRLDVANALVRLRRYPEAVQTMEEVRQATPEWLPQQRYARDILGRIIARRRTLTPQMRTLADAVGVPV